MKKLEDVLLRFDQIIDNCVDDSNHIGYFPILYREVTREIEQQLSTGFFSNSTKVKNFTIKFATKYFNAYDRDTNFESWKIALEENESLLVFQHLLLGMNAHINFDLGVTAAEMFNYDTIFNFQYDFNQINKILVDKVDLIQKRLNKINFVLGLIDGLAQNRDEQIAIFSLRIARSFAWNNAVKLCQLKKKERDNLILVIDKKVALFGQKVIKAPFGFPFSLSLFKFFEKASTYDKLNILLGK